jgi:uncharacterized protein (DUF608 family)
MPQKYITFIISIIIFPFTFLCAQKSHHHVENSDVKPELYGGCPVANFAFTTQILEDGSLFGHIWENPGTLGSWLQDKGSIKVDICKKNQSFSLSTFKNKKVTRRFPFVHSDYSDKSIISSSIHTTAFCPIGINDINTTALPALLLEMNFQTKKAEDFEIILTPQIDQVQQWKNVTHNNYSGIQTPAFQLSCNSNTRFENGQLIIPISLKKNINRQIKILFTAYDFTWISANRYKNTDQLTNYVFLNWTTLKEKTLAFDHALPETGDYQLDNYMRWYMIAGISLTRCTAHHEILTLGYHELNQRDSFWTSWLHLVLFKDMEWQMIQESYAHMQPSGKIPTCILPLIERFDDLDINLFLILRTARYFCTYHNQTEIAALWPRMQKVMDWVMSRDFSGKGLPEQVSFWGDWKDVPYMKDRKYSAFVNLMYLAALKQMTAFADQLKDANSKQRYQQAADKAAKTINSSVKDGGQWNGHFYAQIWKDGSASPICMQDQMIGILYDVIPKDKAVTLMKYLNKHNRTPYGICTSFPYLKGVSDPEGTYHNGAVWPWVSFMDSWARIHAGHKKQGIKLIKTVAKADLVNSGDYVPNEHINSLNGENLGFPIQGWNANLFGVIYFGLVHPEKKIHL